jgi:hypothetical protein
LLIKVIKAKTAYEKIRDGGKKTRGEGRMEKAEILELLKL